MSEQRTVMIDNEPLELAPGATFRNVAEKRGQKDALAGEADGVYYTLDDPVPEGARKVRVLTKARDGLFVLRHSAAHLMASAIKRIWKGVKLGTGPATEKGFYYDVDVKDGVSDSDLRRIEEEMRKIVAADEKFERFEVGEEEALALVDKLGESFKREIVRDFAKTGVKRFSFYKHGDFVDLCEGPHVPSTGFIKAFKITDVSGSYWRGKEGNPQLSRVRGTAFFSDKELRVHERNLEEAAKRDHRKLGPQLDLFSFSDYSPGIAFWHAKGMIVYNELLSFIRDEYRKRGYDEVRAPLIMHADLWRKSGHYDNYKENMFFTASEEVEFALKPMNCPGHCVMFGERPRSYRELPLRLAEMSPLHRNERSGTLHGLMRVRSFSQDDAHIFVAEDQIEGEVREVIAFLQYVYDVFGFAGFRVELSTKPEKSIGSAEAWSKAEEALKRALEASKLDYKLNPGDGAFYGPKIDFHITDALDRSWQCGTVQLDFNLPERFELEFKGADNQPHRPVMIHRALLGSFERMLGVLIEHWAGAFPLWLAPEQVRLLPIAEAHAPYAEKVRARLEEARLRAAVDASPEKVGKRVRDAAIAKVPYILVVGEKEAQAGSVTVRHRGSDAQSPLALDAFVERARDEVARRALAPERTWQDAPRDPAPAKE